MTLDEAIRILYAQELNCRVQTVWDDGLQVSLGDDYNGYAAHAYFSMGQIDKAARWLIDEAKHLYGEIAKEQHGND